jgi:hypothetical protein
MLERYIGKFDTFTSNYGMGAPFAWGREIVIYKDSSNRCSSFLWENGKKAGQKGEVILYSCG